MAKHILVVDDDLDIRTIVQAALEADGYKVTLAENGEDALHKFDDSTPDIVVLDIVLPDLSGTEICAKIRGKSDVPIIFLSGKSDDIDRIIGLELGADDYLTKPFNPRELVARVKAVLRRSGQTDAAKNEDAITLSCGELVLNTEQFRVFWEETEIILTKTEFLLLKTLVRHPGKVYSRSELMNGAYDSDVYVSDRTIDSHIRRLRNKLNSLGASPIQTIRGVGYKIVKS